MNELNGQPGEVRMTITIKRKETGKEETHELVGKVITPESEKDERPIAKENHLECYSFNGSEGRGDGRSNGPDRGERQA